MNQWAYATQEQFLGLADILPNVNIPIVANETQIPLNGNEVKVYFQNQFQKIKAEDINRLSGATPENSGIPALLTALLATIGRLTDTAIGFKIPNTNPTIITVESGLIIRQDAVFRFPEVSITPTSGSLEGIFEIQLEESLTDQSTLMFWDTESERFQPGTGPTRKSYRINLFEKWVNTPGLPEVTNGRIGLLSYKRSVIDGPIAEIKRILPVYDPGLIGIDVSLDPGILNQESLADAINWLFQRMEQKQFLRTSPSPGFDDTQIRFRTQGIYAYWSKNGENWYPFG
ncbi:hypothetical protein [Leptospira licerasiae]|uniref:Uncharacterized protein n=1 Tax=Leptospira licerasiae str. MMD4847 TaxID=1049971 RepID=A0ABN0H9L4_9LEPT|nr:hypothetical protein [Leptospira licerasiae]EIE01505.1 hypothetical protein LEP1GSC185_3922 [Leptospira licerasiae serovar Varillal str. VAR 010]EJZ42266.1 hypothetical protein LEP1GSC178_0086 [Leptospira licerasiae str. MMD4847]